MAQRAVQIGMAGLLSGAIVGSAAVISGVVPLVPPPPTMIALVDCPDSDRVVARVPTGEALLVTARSLDGHWVEVFVGEPEIDRAWVPANTVRLQQSGDRLPIGSCVRTAAAIPSASLPGSPPPIDTFGPPAATVGIVGPTPEPTPLPPGITPGPTATRLPTAKPKPTLVSPTIFNPTPPPATPTPTPTPTPPDLTSPTLSNLHANLHCLDSTAQYSSSNILVTVTDPDDPVALVRVTVQPPGGFIGGTHDMTYIGNNTWRYVLNWSDNWAAGDDQWVNYRAWARDSHGNQSATLYAVTQEWILSDTACYIG